MRSYVGLQTRNNRVERPTAMPVPDATSVPTMEYMFSGSASANSILSEWNPYDTFGYGASPANPYASTPTPGDHGGYGPYPPVNQSISAGTMPYGNNWPEGWPENPQQNVLSRGIQPSRQTKAILATLSL